MINIKINKKKLKVKKNTLIINAAKSININIPNFCYHNKLSLSANCRICLIYIKGYNKLLPACSTKVHENMEIYTNKIECVKNRENIMKFLLINHPLDCPICDQAGECNLQNFSINYGNYSLKFIKKKRIFNYKNLSHLISTREMNRCIHCTRCIRFSEEIAGNKELGMINKGEFSEITTFNNKKINSEISGNMIDICPVGALTSKPFKYKYRVWDLHKTKSISFHDSLGTNIIIEKKNNKIIRVLPYENKNINECWISDKDRFSYLSLKHKDKLKYPMIKKKNIWIKVTWKFALNYIKSNLKLEYLKKDKNYFSILASPNSTLEELFLLKNIIKTLKSENIDFRTKQSNFKLNNKIIPWLGMSITELTKLNNILIIGSFISKEYPILTVRLRKSVKNGTNINIINSIDNNNFIKFKNKIIIKPSKWIMKLNEILLYILKKKNLYIPKFLKNTNIKNKTKNIAKSFLKNKKNAIFIGNCALQHPKYSNIYIISKLISEKTKSKLGHFIENSNYLGCYMTKLFSKKKNINYNNFLKNKCKNYLLFNLEPKFDFYNPSILKRTFKKANMVILMSAFKHTLNFANVILPISTFMETSGTFINCEGRFQSFKSAIKPKKNIIPGWKALCKLSKNLKIKDFKFKSSKEIKNLIFKKKRYFKNLLKKNNKIRLNLKKNFKKSNINKIERITNYSIYYSDFMVRRTDILLKTKNGNINVKIPLNLAKKFKIKKNNIIKIKQNKNKILLSSKINKNLAKNVINIPSGSIYFSNLENSFGNLNIKKIK